MKICIIGAGKLGSSLTAALLKAGNEVTVLDKDQERIQTLGNTYDALTIQMNGLVADNLREIDIQNYDLVIACTDDDQTNMVISSYAKKLGANRVMARVRDPENTNQLEFIKENFGIDQILNPNYACASEMYKYLTEKHSLEGGIFVQNGIAILEFNISKMPSLVNKQMKDTGDILKGILIGCISRDGKIIVPNGSTTLLEEDTIYAVGKEEDIKTLSYSVRDIGDRKKIERVMIAGGGRTGYFLAKMLEKDGIAVKLIENDKQRCDFLARELENSIVIFGSAADLTLLLEENLLATDAFVAATGFDEENLLLSMLVKEQGVEEVVAKVSRPTYSSITEKLGTSAIINPQEIITNNILSYARKSGVVLFSKVIKGQAEFREVQAEGYMPITKSSLKDLTIPSGCIVTSIHRGNTIIIPNGNTQIAAGDRVVLLSLLSSLGELESLLTQGNKTVL